jgi:hypothetical protein
MKTSEYKKKAKVGQFGILNMTNFVTHPHWCGQYKAIANHAAAGAKRLVVFQICIIFVYILCVVCLVNSGLSNGSAPNLFLHLSQKRLEPSLFMNGIEFSWINQNVELPQLGSCTWCSNHLTTTPPEIYMSLVPHITGLVHLFDQPSYY